MIENLNIEWNFIESRFSNTKSICACENEQLQTDYIIKNNITNKIAILGSTCINEIEISNSKELKK